MYIDDDPFELISPHSDQPLDAATQQAVRRVAGQHPRWTSADLVVLLAESHGLQVSASQIESALGSN